MTLYTLAALAAFLTAQVCCQPQWPDAPGQVLSQPSDPSNLTTAQCCTPTFWYGEINDTVAGLTGRFWKDDSIGLTLIIREGGGWQLLDESVFKNYTYLPEEGVCIAPNLQPFYRTSQCIYPDASFVGFYQDSRGTSEMWQATNPGGRRVNLAFDQSCMLSMFKLMSTDGSRVLVSLMYPDRVKDEFDPHEFDKIDTSECYDVNDYAWNLNMTKVIAEAKLFSAYVYKK